MFIVSDFHIYTYVDGELIYKWTDQIFCSSLLNGNSDAGPIQCAFLLNMFLIERKKNIQIKLIFESCAMILIMLNSVIL